MLCCAELCIQGLLLLFDSTQTYNLPAGAGHGHINSSARSEQLVFVWHHIGQTNHDTAPLLHKRRLDVLVVLPAAAVHGVVLLEEHSTGDQPSFP